MLRSLRAFAECAFGRALQPIAARWWANVTSRETIERNDSPYGDVLPHWDKDESLQRFELKIGQHCAAPTHGISALLRGLTRMLVLRWYGCRRLGLYVHPLLSTVTYLTGIAWHCTSVPQHILRTALPCPSIFCALHFRAPVYFPAYRLSSGLVPRR